MAVLMVDIRPIFIVFLPVFCQYAEFVGLPDIIFKIIIK